MPFERFVLGNGLTVIVHEDRKAPVVAVNVTYLVGAKDEPPGRTGFAHLFEHLMFGGSSNLPGSYIVNMSAAGASDLNGTTSHDRTNYYETVPTAALDYALFAESDRMGHFAEAITQETLDQQRGVVMNEKRQTEGAPYGGMFERMLRALYPSAHPYAHTVLGSMQDLADATLEDVRDWFRTWYGPGNAVLTLVGDIDAATAREKAERWFGHIPASRLPNRMTTHAWVPQLPEHWHETLYDRVPLSRLVLAWNIPGYGQVDATLLRLVAPLLTGGRTARLTQRLLYGERRWVTSVSAGASLEQVAGRFAISIDALDGADDFEHIEAEVFAVLDELREQGPTEAELQRLKLQDRAGFLRGTGTVTSVAGLLSDHQRLTGTPDGYRAIRRTVAEASADDIRGVMERWLTRPALHLKALPAPDTGAATAGAVDRSNTPALGVARSGRLPALERATLSNGLQVILARRHDRPLVKMTLHLPTGQGDDPADRDGLARLTLSLTNQGAGERDGDAFAEAAQSIAAAITSCGSIDWTKMQLSALSSMLRPSLALFADTVVRPRFAEKDFLRHRDLQLRALEHELAMPGSLVMHLLPKLLYGAGHRCARSPSGVGTRASLERIKLDDVVGLHARWFRPQGATLVVAGDVTLEMLMPELERCFAGWEGRTPAQTVATTVDTPDRARVCHFSQRAHAEQSHIVAAGLVPDYDHARGPAIDLANEILGGGFSSRINMNLREDKHWTYGARSRIMGAPRAQRVFDVSAPVQTDRTAAAMREIADELHQSLRERPITEDELAPCRHAAIARMAGLGETLDGVLGSIEAMVLYGLPDDYHRAKAERIAALTADEVNEALRQFLRPEQLLWVVVGDREQVEPQLAADGWELRTLQKPDT